MPIITNNPYVIPSFNSCCKLNIMEIGKQALNHALQIVSRHFTNYQDNQGADSEAEVYSVFQTVMNELGLQDRLHVSRNPYSPKKYHKNRGRGYDILISEKVWETNTKTPYIKYLKPLLAIEVRDWDERYISTKVFRDKFLHRFRNVPNLAKQIIHYGWYSLKPARAH